MSWARSGWTREAQVLSPTNDTAQHARGLLHWSDDQLEADLEALGLKALEAADPEDWYGYEDAGTWLPVVARNREALQVWGTFERALVRAWWAHLGTTCRWDPTWIRELFVVHADRTKLLAEGSPLPVGGRLRVFRGVGGVEPHRREAGLSWTLKASVAHRFARCSRDLGLADPVVLEGRVRREHVLVHINCRSESELVCEEVEVLAVEPPCDDRADEAMLGSGGVPDELPGSRTDRPGRW